MRMNTPPKTPKTLANVPPMDDPALEAYRKAKGGYSAPLPPPPVASALLPLPAGCATKRMYSRNRRLFAFGTTRRLPRPPIRPASLSSEPALLQRKAVGLLPRAVG